MAYTANIMDHARKYEAAGDISAEQYTFFKRGANDTVVQSGAGEAAVGVLWNDPAAAGRMAVVITGGEPNVYAGDAIAVGDEVAADANGDAVTAVSTDIVVGIAREAAGGAGELVRIDFLGEAQYTKA